MDTQKLRLLDGQVLVFWDWEVDEDGNNSIKSTQDCTENTSGSEYSDGDSYGTIETVPFKCIGSDKERKYQEVLTEVCDRLQRGITVKVQLIPEPTNKYDNRAIKFVCDLDGQQHTIGYVVRECLNEVHQAIEKSSITRVEFAWVQFRSYRGSIPRYYAAVSVTSNCGWSNTVKRSASTFH